MTPTFQARCAQWAKRAFAYQPLIATSKRERTLRFIEEAIELAQACGLDYDDIEVMARYVFARSVGEVRDEVGGVTTTLAVLCDTIDVDMNLASELCVTKCWENIHKIKEKHKNKPAIIRDQSIDLGPP